MTLHEALQWCENNEVQITFRSPGNGHGNETKMGPHVIILTLDGHPFQEGGTDSPGLKLRRLVQRIEDSRGHA